MATLTDQEIVRRNKVKELEKLGVLPFGHRYDVTTHSDEIFRAFGDKTKEELIDLNINIRIAGRIVLKEVRVVLVLCTFKIAPEEFKFM